jgi:ElaB/YqjD/DUF883 family membrane-anchored ribosome-binding protein
MATETNKKTGISTEIDAIREDIQKLQNDLKDMFHSVGEQSKEKLQESKQKLEAAIKSLQGQAAEKFDEVYDSLREHSQDAVKKSRKQIEERPLTAVFIAFAAGILFDRLIGRR